MRLFLGTRWTGVVHALDGLLWRVHSAIIEASRMRRKPQRRRAGRRNLVLMTSRIVWPIESRSPITVELLYVAGFRLTGNYPVGSDISIIEAKAALA